MRRNGTIIMLLGVLLLFGAGGLAIYNYWDDNRAGDTVEDVLVQLEEETPTPEPEAVPDYEITPEIEMPTKVIDDSPYIGTLYFPDLNRSLPVMSDWNYTNLRTAPCRYKGSLYTGDLIIAGHNYRSHFGPLKNLREGAEVDFTDVDGNLFVLMVDTIEILPGTAVEEMEEGDWPLSIFTCTLGGRTRLTLRCVFA